MAFCVCAAGAVMLAVLQNWHAMVLAWVWMAALALLLGRYWNRDRVEEGLITLPCLFGLWLFSSLQARFLFGAQPPIEPSAALWIISLFGGVIATLMVYNTVLGHWYLEAKARVPVRFLRIGVRLLWFMLGLRLAWNAIQCFQLTPHVQGEPVSLIAYLMTFEGMLLGIGPFMGSLVPFVLMMFVSEMLRIRSTSSATGMLYSATVCVLMGDLAYRYFMLSAGLVL